MQARGSILGFNSKYPSKNEHLSKKSGVLFKKNPKNMTFHTTWCSIQEWVCIQADTNEMHSRFPYSNNFFGKHLNFKLF